MKRLKTIAITYGGSPLGKREEKVRVPAVYYTVEEMELRRVSNDAYTAAIIHTLKSEGAGNGVVPAGRYIKHELVFEKRIVEEGGAQALILVVEEFELKVFYSELIHDQYPIADILDLLDYIREKRKCRHRPAL
jgi:hypothetical protein